MYRENISQITFETVDNFCSQTPRPREGVHLDFKKDFPNNLEKTISAFANTQGGIILIGVDETPTGEAKLPIDGIPLESGLRERAVNKALQAIYPPVFPEVQVCEFSSTGSGPIDKAIVVIRVAESDATPHAIEGKRRVYLRVDNVNQPEELATIDEIEWLQNRRRLAVENRTRVIERATERANVIISQRINASVDGEETFRFKNDSWHREHILSVPRLLEECRSGTLSIVEEIHKDLIWAIGNPHLEWANGHIEDFKSRNSLAVHLKTLV